MTGTIHAVGLDVQFGSLRRQRCSWCGALIDEVDLARTAVALQPCSTCGGERTLTMSNGEVVGCGCLNTPNPGYDPPGELPIWPVGELVEVDTIDGSGVLAVVSRDTWPDSIESPGEKRVPDGACLHLDPDVTR